MLLDRMSRKQAEFKAGATSSLTLGRDVLSSRRTVAAVESVVFAAGCDGLNIAGSFFGAPMTSAVVVGDGVTADVRPADDVENDRLLPFVRCSADDGDNNTVGNEVPLVGGGGGAGRRCCC